MIYLEFLHQLWNATTDGNRVWSSQICRCLKKLTSINIYKPSSTYFPVGCDRRKSPCFLGVINPTQARTALCTTAFGFSSDWTSVCPPEDLIDGRGGGFWLRDGRRGSSCTKGTVCSLRLIKLNLTSTRVFRKARDKFRVQNNIGSIGEIHDIWNQNNRKVQSSGY